jgi:XTP/dITP diphosphohydrolase
MHSVLYATTNPAKFSEVQRLFIPHSVSVLSPSHLNQNLEIDEPFTTLEENAVTKAKAYIEQGIGMVVMADDAGLEIDALDGEPGVHVRRWKDGQTRMADEEIVQYTLDRLRDVPDGQRGAQFRVVAAVAREGQDIRTFEGVLRGVILQQPQEEFIVEGYPFESIFWVPEWQMVLGEFHQRQDLDRSTHASARERAFLNALPEVLNLLETI